MIIPKMNRLRNTSVSAVFKDVATNPEESHTSLKQFPLGTLNNRANFYEQFTK